MSGLLNPFISFPGEEDPGPGDEVSTWVIDFMNEVYTQDGDAVAVATVIDMPEMVGASGLEILDDAMPGVVAILGDLLADILTIEWTLVIEWEEVLSSFTTYPILIDETDNFQQCAVYNDFPDIVAGDSCLIIREATVSGSFGPGVHKAAFTRTADFASLSVNGGGVQTNTTDVNVPAQLNPTYTQAGFGGSVGDFSFNGCFIRRLDLMPPVADAALPGLSS